MRRLARTGTAVLLASVALFAAAQQPIMGIGYVDSQYLLTLLPAYAQIVETREMANAELGQVAATVQDLQAKQQAGTALTEQEEELLQVSISTLQTLQTRYDGELQALVQPAIATVNAAIEQVATGLGIGVVLDASRAYDTGLVVYGAPENDLTLLVAEVLQAGE